MVPVRPEPPAATDHTARGVVGVFGDSGFVGGAVVEALVARGHEVRNLSMPWIERTGPLPDASAIAEQLKGLSAVVNAVGEPDASSPDGQFLDRVNGEWPGILARACASATVPRLVHVSSAVVQGRRPQLDDTESFEPFSPYASSKILGERRVLGSGNPNVVIYRPPSVHSIDRRVTRQLGRLGRSVLSFVAAPTDAPSPQALIENVSDAVAFLATCSSTPPRIVCHPWEGITVSSVLTFLGGRPPRVLPRMLAVVVVRVAHFAGRVVPRFAPMARRVEMVWFGQRQRSSWLTSEGWVPPAGEVDWLRLGRELSQSGRAGVATQ